MNRINGLINMSGFIIMICILIIIAVFWFKKNKNLHKLHKPITVFAGVITIVHTVVSLLAVTVIDVKMMLVIISGLLAVAGFAAGIVTLLRKEKPRLVVIKKHIIYSFISVGLTVLHIVLSEVL